MLDSIIFMVTGSAFSYVLHPFVSRSSIAQQLEQSSDPLVCNDASDDLQCDGAARTSASDDEQCDGGVPFWQGGERVVRLRDRSFTSLKVFGLLTKQRVHSRYTLPHPQNRWGDVLVVPTVQPHIEDILDVGFSWSEVAQAAAFQMPVDQKQAKEIEDIVAKVTSASGGRLAPVVPGQATLLVCVCTHTSAGMHAVWVGAASESAKIAVDGKLSLARIKELDSDFGVAIEEGIEYSVIHRAVAEEWPDFVKLVQEAGNASSGVAKGDTWMHNLLRVHSFAKDAAALGNPPDWDRVHDQCLRSKPTHAHDIPELLTFVQKWSGGLECPIFLKMVQEYCRYVPVQRVVRGWFFKSLNDLELGTGKGGMLRAALLMAMAGCRESHCNAANEANLYKASDVQSMGKSHKELAFKTEEVLSTFSMFAAAEKVEAKFGAKGCAVTFNTMIDIVNHAFRKTPSDYTLASLESYCAKAYLSLEVMAKSQPDKQPKLSKNPWAKVQIERAELAKTAAKRPAATQIVELQQGATGTVFKDMKGELARLGFVEGALARSKKSDAELKIVSIGDIVTFVFPGDKRRKVCVHIQDVIDSYDIVKEDIVPSDLHLHRITQQRKQ